MAQRYYNITLYRGEQVIRNGIASPDPLHALRRISNMFTEDGGFGGFSKVVCRDQETGAVQWEFVIH